MEHFNVVPKERNLFRQNKSTINKIKDSVMHFSINMNTSFLVTITFYFYLLSLWLSLLIFLLYSVSVSCPNCFLRLEASIIS